MKQSSGNLKEARFEMRVSASEYAAWKIKAKAAGLSVAEFLASLAAGVPLPRMTLTLLWIAHLCRLQAASLHISHNIQLILSDPVYGVQRKEKFLEQISEVLAIHRKMEAVTRAYLEKELSK